LDEDDWRRTNPRFQGENFYKNLELADKIKEVANKKGITPSQLSLAWLLAQGNVIGIIDSKGRQVPNT
jgi:aryl-alcohol dehydrogenase-like predicted oxidoreductase